jgi:murein DD-endopeptidase MepM/ murein hydrolase activator NlpD
MELKHDKSIIILSLIAFTFVIVALVSAFYTSYAGDIKKEQLKLIRANILLSQSIQEKKEEYEQIQDKIEDIEELIGDNSGTKNSNISRLLANMSKNTKKLIVDSIPSGYPSNAKRVTSSFGYRMHPIYKTKRFHHGIDFGGKLGTPIVATADGIVEFSDFDKGYGNLVVIHHNFGFKTAYGHMQRNLQVQKGDFVKKGEVLGYLGNTGISTGPHLHYEVKYIKNVLDPKNFLTFNINNFDTLLYNENRIAWDSLTRAIMNLYGRVSLAKLL